MKLEFQLLVVDDNPGTIENAVALLADYLDTKGFSLRQLVADDLSDAGLRKLARQAGRDFDLVAVDYNLGREDIDGAKAASRLRRELQFTDMVFYSSDPSVNFYQELARQEVPGVFVASRKELDEALKGLADTVIGKAIDLNHMRGIAMAEVAEMDVLMEEILEKVFSSKDEQLVAKAGETLAKLLDGAEQNLKGLREIVGEARILDIVTDSRLFSSMHRYKAINRVAKCLDEKPAAAIQALKSYDADIIQNRNTLAHAKEDVTRDGTVTLRAIKRGRPAVTIDEEWMVAFRGMLRTHRTALSVVCDALSAHVDARAAGQSG